ncbi:MAG: hypothetical protein JW984_01140 [Deltaproteobacteria bacterium]|uniref:Glycosyltransferase RgtA/B/C/D-like domain-containing protein n=1 Tax=Candidatus Zymogenus saltonus TaxID=2844893 RepID=A0A9D8KBL1_9DELT|nr:hypothetical protein [Candidatus Zymogenus saltonus]
MNTIFCLFILFFVIVFVIYSYRMIPEPPIVLKADAAGIGLMAFNLGRHGTLSMASVGTSGLENITPTSYREPGYPAVLALAMLLSPSLRNLPQGNFVSEDVSFQVPSKSPSYMEMLILLFAALISMCVVLRFTKSRLLSIAVLFGVGFSPALLLNIRHFLTENLTALLILAASIALMLSVRDERKRYYLLSGILFGMLTLTKATFQLAWPLLLGFMILYLYKKKVPLKKGGVFLVIFLVSYFAVVSPWMLRNYSHFNRAFIAERGGSVLMVRANYSMMNSKEYLAHFLLWTPTVFAQKLKDRYFNDEEISRLYRSNPDGYRNRARALRRELIEKYNDSAKADSVLTSMAVKQLVTHPIRHLLTCIPIAWKGIFVEMEAYPGLYGNNLSPLISLVLFGGFFSLTVYSIVKGNWEYLAFFFLANYLFIMHVLFTHNIPRYNIPLIPVLWIGSITILWLLASSLFNKLGKISRFEKGKNSLETVNPEGPK